MVRDIVEKSQAFVDKVIARKKEEEEERLKKQEERKKQIIYCSTP